MRRLALIAGIAAAFGGLAAGPLSALPDGATQTRIDADSWEALGRADFALLALDRLLLTRPDDAALMLEIGQLSLRLNQLDAARKTLDQMRERQPQAPETAQLALALKLATEDRLKLAGIRRLSELKRHDEALTNLQQLFPDGPPDGDLGIAYWRILFEHPKHRLQARAGVAAIVARHPEQSRYRLALADLMTRDDDTRAEGLRIIESIAATQATPSPALLDLWRRSLLRGPVTAGSRGSAERYLSRAETGLEADPELRDWRLRRTPAGSPVRRPGPAPRLATRLGAVEARLAAGRPEAALALLDRDADSRKPGTPAAGQRAAALHAEAQDRLAVGDRAGALVPLREALRLAPADALLRLELVRLLRAEGETAEAEQIIEAGLAPLAVAPPGRDAETRRRHAEALALAADAQDAGDRRAAATALLEQAQAANPDDPWLRFRLARRYLAAGVPDEARRLMDEGRARAARSGAPDGELRFAQALILESLDATTEARAALAPIPDAERSDGMRALDQRLALREARTGIEALIAAGDRDGAVRLLADTETRALGDGGSASALAALWGELGDEARGLALLDRAALAGQTPDADTRLQRIGLLETRLERLAASDPAQAEADEQRIAQELALLAGQTGVEAGTARRIAAADGRRSLRLADRQFAAGDTLAGWQTLDRAVAAHPDDPALRDARAERLLTARRWREARTELAAVAAGSDEAWRAGRARDRLADLDTRSDGFIATGPSLRERPGPAGRSRYRNLEIPVQLRWPLDVDEALFAHVDRVQASAGRLPADYDQAALFGQVQAQGPASLAAFPDGDAQRDDGVALAAGWTNGIVRADIGTTPIGFAVVDVVGGLRVGGRLGGLDVSADLARRPITNSLLSYAGVRDPATGEVWGGARNQRLRLRMAHYGEQLSYNASLEAGVITGRSMQANRQVQFNAGFDWKFQLAPTQRLYAGLDTRIWSYQRNLSEFTWGHGGYYSPQLYTALVLPLEWQGRLGRFTYRLRGSVALTYDQVDAAPFYPGNAALQAQALASPLPAGFSTPDYGSISGTGFGRSLSGTVEYALTPKWSIGANVDIDRAAFYAPNFYSLYLRRSFRDQPLLRAFPPRAPEPYSSY